MLDAVPADEPLSATEELSGARRVIHWYDFLCPFCYVGQQRNTIFESHGFEVVDMPFQAHPDIPPGGRAVGQRNGPMYAYIEAEARAADLPLIWPDRLPNTRMALAAAEWTRRRAPHSFPALEKALFTAHFALGEDLGDRRVIDRHAAEAGIDIAAMHAGLENGGAYALVDRAEALGRSLGVRGTPAWFVAGRVVEGLYPREQFERLAQTLAAEFPGH
jgi:predicted DsbA family dithiol-disulfide isomerase